MIYIWSVLKRFSLNQIVSSNQLVAAQLLVFASRTLAEGQLGEGSCKGPVSIGGLRTSSQTSVSKAGVMGFRY